MGMSAFEDMIAAGMGEAEDVFGNTTFTLDAKAYTGILNEYEGEQEVELDGVLGNYNATLVCQKPQFRFVAKPLQKTLHEKVITLDGLTYVVSRAAVDSNSVTLGLRIQRRR